MIYIYIENNLYIPVSIVNDTFNDVQIYCGDIIGMISDFADDSTQLYMELNNFPQYP